jgi:hypothetical protein
LTDSCRASKSIADEANERHQQAKAAIGEQRRQAATAQVNVLADATTEHRCRKAAAASVELYLAEVQRLKDALAEETCRRAALAEAKRRKNRHSVDAAIERIRMELALCAAPLDAILAEIACEATAFETAPCPHHPTSYVDAVLSTMRGAHNRLCPLLSHLLLSSTII